MKKIITLIVFFIINLPIIVHADEAFFGYLYTTDSLPKGQWEYEQTQTWRSGKARGIYNAIDLRNEIEYGVTDKFSASLYLNSSYLYMVNGYSAENPSINVGDKNTFGINGTTVELKYRVLSPYTDPLGLSLYMEPEMGIRHAMDGLDVIERAIEFRLIVQKNFFQDYLM